MLLRCVREHGRLYDPGELQITLGELKQFEELTGLHSQDVTRTIQLAVRRHQCCIPAAEKPEQLLLADGQGYASMLSGACVHAHVPSLR